jgi:NAD dependent epimerase/dehydratase family enzyme
VGTPTLGAVDAALVASCDAIVNLAGAPIAHWPWTARWREEILQSRVRTTATLARAIALAPSRPTYVVASGMAIHGDDRGGGMAGRDE